MQSQAGEGILSMRRWIPFSTCLDGQVRNYRHNPSGQWLSVRKQQCLSSHAWFNIPSKHCVAAQITRKVCVTLWLLCLLAVALLVRTWGKLVLPLQNKFFVSLCCSCKFLNYAAINVYTHSTTILPAVKICTLDSAIYSLRSQQQGVYAINDSTWRF